MPPDPDLPRTILLALCAGGADACDDAQIAALSGEDWDWIAARAAQYRLLPLCHAALSQKPDWPAPGAFRDQCMAAHRYWVFRSLIMQKALIEIGELLDAHAIAYAALKGASLSLEFYAEPALRPMRDLDIIVAPRDALRAYDLLKHSGFAKVPGAGDYGLEGNHHLPILQNANKVYVELHHRIAPRDWEGAQVLGARLLDNARRVDFQGHAIAMAHPTDTLLHLIVHAAFQHLFDNGPSLLSDMAVLDKSGLIQPDEVEAFAAQYGLSHSLALARALHAKYCGDAPDAKLDDAAPVPPDLLAQAADLMTQDPQLHWQRLLLRKRRQPVRRMIDGVARAFSPSQRDLEAIAGKPVSGLSAAIHYPRWLWDKTRVYLGAEFKPQLNASADIDTRLEVWLGRPDDAQKEAGR